MKFKTILFTSLTREKQTPFRNTIREIEARRLGVLTLRVIVPVLLISRAPHTSFGTRSWWHNRGN